MLVIVPLAVLLGSCIALTYSAGAVSMKQTGWLDVLKPYCFWVFVLQVRNLNPIPWRNELCWEKNLLILFSEAAPPTHTHSQQDADFTPNQLELSSCNYENSGINNNLALTFSRGSSHMLALWWTSLIFLQNRYYCHIIFPIKKLRLRNMEEDEEATPHASVCKPREDGWFWKVLHLGMGRKLRSFD